MHNQLIKDLRSQLYLLLFALLLLVILALALTLPGCAGCRNDIAARGGLIGSHSGNYIIIHYSGNLITDVWVLQDVYVQSETNSDGWRFTDADNNVIFLGGDVKVVRIKDDTDLAKWHEYHMEFEDKPYQETPTPEKQ